MCGPMISFTADACLDVWSRHGRTPGFVPPKATPCSTGWESCCATPAAYPWGHANVVVANKYTAMVYSGEWLAHLLADVRDLDGWPAWSLRWLTVGGITTPLARSHARWQPA